jgi:hypothetical protein
MKLQLPQVTLIGIDCVDVKRLQKGLDISSEHIEFGAVKMLTSLPTEDLRKVSIDHINSIEEYSKFCIKDLVQYVDTEYALVIQYDGFVLNADAWSEEFLKYDYIGAVWQVGPWFGDDFPQELYGTEIVGNGGFSLRSKKLLEASSRLFNEGKISRYQPEDVALCVYNRELLEKEGIVFAPLSVAKKFSYNIKNKNTVWSGEFGFHGLKESNKEGLATWLEGMK